VGKSAGRTEFAVSRSDEVIAKSCLVASIKVFVVVVEALVWVIEISSEVAALRHEHIIHIHVHHVWVKTAIAVKRLLGDERVAAILIGEPPVLEILWVGVVLHLEPF
jgi:hypothetical protein